MWRYPPLNGPPRPPFSFSNNSVGGYGPPTIPPSPINSNLSSSYNAAGQPVRAEVGVNFSMPPPPIGGPRPPMNANMPFSQSQTIPFSQPPPQSPAIPFNQPPPSWQPHHYQQQVSHLNNVPNLEHEQYQNFQRFPSQQPTGSYDHQPNLRYGLAPPQTNQQRFPPQAFGDQFPSSRQQIPWQQKPPEDSKGSLNKSLYKNSQFIPGSVDDSSATEEHVWTETEKEDRRWISAWLNKRNLNTASSYQESKPSISLEKINDAARSKCSRGSRNSVIKLGEFRNLMVEAAQLLSRFKQLSSGCSSLQSQSAAAAVDSCNDLSATGESIHTKSVSGFAVADDSLQHVNECQIITKRLKEIRALIDNEQVISDVKQQISVRKKKRDRLRRKRQEEYNIRIERLERAKKLDQELVNCMKQVAEKELAIKREKELKTVADKTLAEVRQKLSESYKADQLLTQLKKLRQARKDKASRISDGRSMARLEEEEIKFEERQKALQQLISKQIALYTTEQQTLEVMLDMETEEDLVRERIAKKKKEEQKLREYRRVVTSQLFSHHFNDVQEENDDEADDDDEGLDEQDALFTFRQYYDAAQNSLPALLHIRREWDVYLVSDNHTSGSSLPFGWIEPQEPSSDVWASYLI